MSREERTNSILERILPSIQEHQKRQYGKSIVRPFTLGLTGLQGCGKSTTAADIVEALNTKHQYRTIEISLDDFYKTHEDQLILRETHSQNRLLKVRGQPGTHDTALAAWFFAQFTASSSKDVELSLPVFDKSLFNGDGDRVPRSAWRSFSREAPIDVIVFEGWCVGFRPLTDQEIQQKWMQAKCTRAASESMNTPSIPPLIDPRYLTTTLADHRLEDLLFINKQLAEYCQTFMGSEHFDYLVHLDTADLVNVYTWRMEQEHVLRAFKRGGMTDEQVTRFVQGYMPAYELYLDGLRAGFFLPSLLKKKDQLHVLLDKSRNIIRLETL